MDPGLAFLLGGLCALAAAAASLAVWGLPALRRRLLDEERDRLRREVEVAAREQALRERADLEAGLAATRRELKDLEARCRAREDALDRRTEAIEDRERRLSVREAELKGAQATLDAERAEVERQQQRELRELERISGLRREEAEDLLLGRVEQRCQVEAAEVRARADAALAHDLARRAREALVAALQRAAWAHGHPSMVTVVPLPSDDLKGLLVGRDARNVRTFEQEAGVDLLIDDTPGVVVLSSFDPLRREVARRALVRLLDDGRIQPDRIAEAVKAAGAEVEETTEALGRAAAAEARVEPLHPRLLTLLGRLEYRTSEGQNVRLHAVETARLAGLLAAELGLDEALARRAGLLHDVGLAVEHEVDGSHAAVGADFARRCDEDPLVVDAIAAHHEEVQAASPYAALVQLANALSTGRPGARDGALEQAIRRRAEVEALALAQPGVLRALALQAGRELRIVVDPQKHSDRTAQRLARDVARAIEAAEVGPGEVKVTVVREARAEETAR
ncbi:MAG: ribonuclease Y [Planctomycetes bacterium]|nr:ribonuclease Y [Planctomycetota bacterium]